MAEQITGLTDDDIETTLHGTTAVAEADPDTADGTDADGTDGDDADGTDGTDGTDADGTDA
jgi:hypothetical protein